MSPCVKCKHHHKVLGECHRHPPVLWKSNNFAEWVRPKVGEMDSCGDFDLKDKIVKDNVKALTKKPAKKKVAKKKTTKKAKK